MGSGCRPAGSDAELQPDARLLPLPAGQALRPVLRHRRQGAAVWTPRGHLQAVAHVASKGEASGGPTEGTLACFTLIKVRSEHRHSFMALFPVWALYYILFCGRAHQRALYQFVDPRNLPPVGHMVQAALDTVLFIAAWALYWGLSNKKSRFSLLPQAQRC